MLRRHREGAGGGRRPGGRDGRDPGRELGASVTLLEAEQVGGTNVNRGPTPVRTLARAARLARDWSSWERFGLQGPRPVPNLDAVLANCALVARYPMELGRRAAVDPAQRVCPPDEQRCLCLFEAAGPVLVHLRAKGVRRRACSVVPCG